MERPRATQTSALEICEDIHMHERRMDDVRTATWTNMANRFLHVKPHRLAAVLQTASDTWIQRCGEHPYWCTIMAGVSTHSCWKHPMVRDAWWNIYRRTTAHIQTQADDRPTLLSAPSHVVRDAYCHGDEATRRNRDLHIRSLATCVAAMMGADDADTPRVAVLVRDAIAFGWPVAHPAVQTTRATNLCVRRRANTVREWQQAYLDRVDPDVIESDPWTMVNYVNAPSWGAWCAAAWQMSTGEHRNIQARGIRATVSTAIWDALDGDGRDAVTRLALKTTMMTADGTPMGDAVRATAARYLSYAGA